jgi:hypothetical protein
MDELLGSPTAPRATIVSVAHLDDRQRAFVIALLVSELVAWMRRQPASSGLRALLYMDEVQGIVPPHPANPPTKAPILTLFKQGRAYGVGAWVATQNPVDLDYKALGNAGVKLVGRLITDRDRDRALEGLGMKKLPDGRDADDIVAGLGKREFLLTDVRSKQRAVNFSSRWAMSYLRGPVTLAEMGPLLDSARPQTERGIAPDSGRAADPNRRYPPPLTVETEIRFDAGSVGVARPWVVVRNRITIQRTTIDLFREISEVWRLPTDDDGSLRWEDAELLPEIPVLVVEPPAEMQFPVAAPAKLAGEVRKASSSFAAWRARRPVTVLVNEKLKMAAEEGEDRETFLARCLDAADVADDTAQARITKRYEGRMKTLRKRLDRERDELDRDRVQLDARKAEEKMGMVEGLFSVLLGSKSIGSASRKAASKLRTAAGKRRMRQTAEGSVIESENEIDRLENEIQALAEELENEIERIATESEETAEKIEEKGYTAKKTDVEVQDLWLVWR